MNIIAIMVLVFCESGGGNRCDTIEYPMPNWETCLAASRAAKLGHQSDEEGTAIAVYCAGKEG